MKIWYRLQLYRYFRVLISLQLGAIGIYISTDLIFKLEHFAAQPRMIIHYYLSHSLPFAIITFPILAFAAISISQYHLRVKREWQLSKLMSHEQEHIQNLCLYLSITLTLFWFTVREVALPAMAEQLQIQSDKVEKNTKRQIFFIERENDLHLLSWSKPKLFHVHLQDQDLIQTQSLTWQSDPKELESSTKGNWNLAPTSSSTLPTDIDLAFLMQKTTPLQLTSLFALLKKSSLEPQQDLSTLNIIERLLLPLIFTILWFQSAKASQLCGKNGMALCIPALGFTGFVAAMIHLRFSSLSFGYTSGILSTSAVVALLIWLCHKLRAQS